MPARLPWTEPSAALHCSKLTRCELSMAVSSRRSSPEDDLSADPTAVYRTSASLNVLVQRCRELGNDAFRKKRFAGNEHLCFWHQVSKPWEETLSPRLFAEAVELYTQAIAGSGGDAILFSNRAAAHLARYVYPQAMQDALKAVQLDPTWPKAFYRQALQCSCCMEPSGYTAVMHL